MAALAVSAIVAILLGLLFFDLSQAARLIQYGGYWFLFVTFILFGWSQVELHRRAPIPWETIREEWKYLLVIPAGGLILLLHEPYSWKVMADEAVLLVTSLSIHLHREVYTPVRAHDLSGAYLLLDGYVDKRPYFFPFLLSLIHDVTGYRPSNAFALNTGLIFLFLGLLYLCGRQLAGKGGAVLAVLLMTGLPLLAQNATGAGFDLVNLVMLGATLLLGIHYARSPSGPALTAFCLAAVLLAQTRYESALFVGAVALIVLAVWWKDRRVTVTWPMVALPFLLLPYLLQHRLMRAYDGFWQLPAELEKPFSLDYFYTNLGHALNYLLDFGPERLNSILLTVIGIAGLVFFGVSVLRALIGRRFFENPAEAVTACFAAIVLLNFGILLAYHWGQIDSYEVSRLSLPFQFLLTLASVFLLAQMAQYRHAWTGFGLVATLFIVGHSIPVSANHFATQTYVPGRAAEWMREVLEEHEDRHYFYIARHPMVPIVYQRPAISVERAKERPESLGLHVERGTFDDIVVFQVIGVDVETGYSWVREEHDLGDRFLLETIRERRIGATSVVRFSRITGIRDEETAADPETSPRNDELP